MADSDAQPADDPSRLRVALALGSGGARGYAHIGVIHELRDRKLIDAKERIRATDRLMTSSTGNRSDPVGSDWPWRLLI